MDKVIETIYSIEERAQRIMETTSNEKDALKSEYESKKASYEKDVTDATDKKINELGFLLKKQLDDEYNQIKKQAQDTIASLNHTYETKHAEMAKEIFKQITEV